MIRLLHKLKFQDWIPKSTDHAQKIRDVDAALEEEISLIFKVNKCVGTSSPAQEAMEEYDDGINYSPNPDTVQDVEYTGQESVTVVVFLQMVVNPLKY